MKKILLILLSTFSWQLLAGEFDKAKMDAFFKLLDDKQQSMGTVSLFQNGKEVYQNTIGYVDIEADIKSNNSTTYRIGSISKTFTAVLIMQLIEAGQLKLNDTLDSYYPQVKNSESITIEHLLRHRSGLFNFTQLEDYTSWMSKPLTDAAMLNIILFSQSK